MWYRYGVSDNNLESMTVADLIQQVLTRPVVGIKLSEKEGGTVIGGIFAVNGGEAYAAVEKALADFYEVEATELFEAFNPEEPNATD